MRHIDRKTALEVLEKVVETYGTETKYADRDMEFSQEQESCRYVNELGAPMCLIGVALVDYWDVEPESLIRVNEQAVHDAADEIEDLYFDEDAVTVLGAAQVSQDQGRTWGEALAKAKSA